MGKVLADFIGASTHEIFGICHKRVIIAQRHFPCTRSGTAFDLIEQTGSGSVLVITICAGADQERALQGGHGTIHRPSIGKGAKIRAFAFARTAMFHKLRRVMIPRQQNIGKTLIITHQHIELRLQLLDQIGFQQQGFGLSAGGDKFHGRG